MAKVTMMMLMDEVNKLNNQLIKFNATNKKEFNKGYIVEFGLQFSYCRLVFMDLDNQERKEISNGTIETIYNTLRFIRL